MVTIKKQHHQFAHDVAANRVYQAFERLQFARYNVNTRRSAKGESHDEAAIMELKAAEDDWHAAHESVPSGF
jgi:hypothetical protein